MYFVYLVWINFEELNITRSLMESILYKSKHYGKKIIYSN